jgi:hypothetical protein
MQDMLQVENFVEWKSQAKIIMHYFKRFMHYKDQVLYDKPMPNKIDESDLLVNTDALDYPNIKMAIKLAVL